MDARNLHVLEGKWTGIWKREPLGIIKETSHTRLRKSLELKIPVVWESVTRGMSDELSCAACSRLACVAIIGNIIKVC